MSKTPMGTWETPPETGLETILAIAWAIALLGYMVMSPLMLVL